jgi:hypothetical protein
MELVIEHEESVVYRNARRVTARQDVNALMSNRLDSRAARAEVAPTRRIRPTSSLLDDHDS